MPLRPKPLPNIHTPTTQLRRSSLLHNFSNLLCVGIHKRASLALDLLHCPITKVWYSVQFANDVGRLEACAYGVFQISYDLD
jgi:hypothetical protein